MNDFDQEYESLISGRQEFRLILERLLEVLLDDEGIRFHSVTSRIKPKGSVLRKLARSDKQRSLSDLTDLLGTRIITYFPDEIDTVAKLIEREFLIDKANSVDKRALLDPDRFGYLSLHYVAKLSPQRAILAEYRSYKDIWFEVQIRSILQHAWAEIEHDLDYKSESEIPKMARRRFSRLAGLLELADDEFLGIREELASSHDLREDRAADLQSEIEHLLTRPCPFNLPAWPGSFKEAEYNAYVARSDPDFLLMDRVLLEIPSSGGRFEACDLLGPDDALIHISRPRNSAAFGHLFNQALVSTEFLLNFAEARAALAGAVEHRGSGRTLRHDFRPREVVLAFPSSGGPIVPVERIPQFSRVTLSRLANALEEQGVLLIVVGIDESSLPAR